jgi:hypothetical protein
VSDFLRNLVERSLAPSGAVRPQLLSIFEPPPANGGEFFGGNENPELAAVGKHQDPSAQVTPVQPLRYPTTSEPPKPFIAPLSKAGLTSADPAPDTPRVDLPGKEPRVAHMSERYGAADATERNEEGAARSDLRNPSLVRPQMSPSGKQPSALSSEQHTTADVAKTDEQAAAPPPLLPAEKTPGTSKSIFRDPTENRAHRVRAEKIIEMIAGERGPNREPTLSRDVPAISRRPPSPRPFASRQQSRNPAVAPSINVTIGRIEVRATPPPPARSQPARASAPITSLDEYLRQRAGGDRR